MEDCAVEIIRGETVRHTPVWACGFRYPVPPERTYNWPETFARIGARLFYGEPPIYCSLGAENIDFLAYGIGNMQRSISDAKAKVEDILCAGGLGDFRLAVFRCIDVAKGARRSEALDVPGVLTR